MTMHQVSVFVQIVVILASDVLSANLRHQVLQLAIVLVCGISQLSPGAYFLRRDLFPSIVMVRRQAPEERGGV